MRLKIEGTIIEGVFNASTNYKHEMYSMVLNNLSTNRAKYLHNKERFKRLYTFSNICKNNNSIHFYASGQDEIIKDLINNLLFNRMIRIGDIVLCLTNISPLNDKLDKKDFYTFKTNFIVNQKINNKNCLSTDFEYIKRRIGEIATDKHNEINNCNLVNDLKVEIISCKKTYTKYKNTHINSYKSRIKITGNQEIINTIFNVGIGENTATGHGFVWEV